MSPQVYYEQFADKEEVLVAAYRACAEHMLVRIRSAGARSEISELPRLALGGLLQAVADYPDAGRLLCIEALSGGAHMNRERACTFRRLERYAADLLQPNPDASPTLDIPVIAMVGALRHIVSRHLHNYLADELPARLEDGLSWLYSYARAPGSERWSTSRGALLADSSLTITPQQEDGPERLPPGRHGLPAGAIARSQRMRLINATAAVVMAKGYAQSTVNDVVGRAHVAKPVFYRYFSDKQHAFLEAQRLPTQFVFDRCTEAYFSSQQWPERVWSTLEVLSGLIAMNPATSYLVAVECYAAGTAAIHRAEEVAHSFTFFLEEGYSYRGAAGSLPRLCSEAIAGAIFEIVRHHVARRDPVGLAARLPQLTYIALAPFTGADQAIELVEELRAQAQGRG